MLAGNSEAGLTCFVTTRADNPRVHINHIAHGRTIQDLVSLQRKPVFTMPSRSLSPAYIVARLSID